MIRQFLLWLLFNQCILAKYDCHWLGIIYEKMGGDVSQIPQDCCEMDGVQCTQDGSVTSISWNGKGLTGSISQEIGNLVHLQEL